MGSNSRAYDPKFKAKHFDKRRNKKEFVPKRYRNQYERRFKK